MQILKFLFTILVFLILMLMIVRYPIISIYAFMLLASILVFNDLVILREY